MTMYSASVGMRYEHRSEYEPDPFIDVANQFDGDLKDPAIQWAVRITNEETGESRLIDTETNRVIRTEERHDD